MIENYDVSNYSGAMKFATDCFHYLNGKVNYMIPANCLIFGHNNMGDAYGDTTLDIVEINIPNISRVAKKGGFLDESKFRGLIFYTVLHELLHLDQDISLYESIFRNYGKKKITEIIEQSCHAMTLKVFNDILNCSFYDDFDLDTIAIPSSEIFMNIPYTDTDQIEQWVNSYYRVQNIAEKALYFLGCYLNIDFLETAIVEEATNILVNLTINNKPSGCEYVYYLRQWMVPQIFNLLRPIAYFTKAQVPHQPSRLSVDAKTYKDEYGDPSGYLIFDVNLQLTAPLTIVNQVSNPTLLY